MSSRRVAAALLALSFASALAGRSLADPSPEDRERARSLMDLGDEKTAAKDHEAALKAYRGADAIMGVPTTGIEVARTLERLGKLVEARDAYVRVTRMSARAGEPKPFTVARVNAERAAADLEARIPTLTVELRGLPQGARAELTLDGEAFKDDLVGLPVRVNPGEHRASGSAPGFSRAEGAVTLFEREAKALVLSFQAQPGRSNVPKSIAADSARGSSEDAEPSRGWMWVGFGTGVAGIGTGTVTGVLSLSKASQAKEICDGTRCPESARSDIEASKTLANVSNVSFAVGALGVGIGLWQLIASGSASATDASPKASTLSVQPYAGLGDAGLVGRF